jgi:hypothetical protein
VKAAVFRRDGLRCCCCGATKRLEIDHIVPVYLGGSSDIDQLQTLCRACNSDKAINELNFRITRTPLDGPARFATLTLPTQDDLTSEDSWLQYIQRSVNFFYRCAAVDTIVLQSESPGYEVRLQPGIDSTWIEPHLGNFGAHISEARTSAGLTAVGGLRVAETA